MNDPSTYLQPGERLLWSGHPRQGVMFAGTDLFLVPFSLMWGGFAIFWEGTVIATKAPVFFKLWGIPFVLVGLYLIIGRFFIDAWARRNTTYMVTDQRVLIARERPFAKLTALNLRTLPDVGLSERSDGSGTIQFGTASFSGRGGMGFWMPALDSTPRFIGIQDARSVFNTIQSQLARVK